MPKNGKKLDRKPPEWNPSGTGTGSTGWTEADKDALWGWDFTEYGDPQNRTGACFFCDRMYACEC